MRFRDTNCAGMSRAVLLSVKPVYAKALLAGTKTAEVRRRFPAQPTGTVLFIYASNPLRAVLGTMALDHISRVESEAVSRTYRGQIEIDRDDLAVYLGGVETAAVLEVSEPRIWSHPVPLDTLRARVQVEPPQSFRYLTEHQARLLIGLGEPG